MVTGDVIDTLSSIGILIIVYSLTDDYNSYYNYLPYPLSLSGASFTVEGLPANRYGVSIFVTEENGLPYFRAAATPRKIDVEGIDSIAIKYRIAGNFRGRKLSRIGRKSEFRGENFRGSLKIAKFVNVFSLESFPLNGTAIILCIRNITMMQRQQVINIYLEQLILRTRFIPSWVVYVSLVPSWIVPQLIVLWLFISESLSSALMD